jgi:thioredoxin 1
MKNINETEWPEAISAGLVLVDFWAEWCGPCRAMGPILEQVHEQLPSVEVVKVNVDDNPKLAAEQNVKSLPTLQLYKDGELIWSEPGSKAFGALIQKLSPHV